MTSPKAGQRIVRTPIGSSEVGGHRVLKPSNCSAVSNGGGGSRTPRMCASRLRLGSTEASYASGEEKSRFQYFSRLGRRLVDLLQEKTVDAGDQLAGDVAGHRQRLRPGQGRTDCLADVIGHERNDDQHE